MLAQERDVGGEVDRLAPVRRCQASMRRCSSSRRREQRLVARARGRARSRRSRSTGGRDRCRDRPSPRRPRNRAGRERCAVRRFPPCPCVFLLQAAARCVSRSGTSKRRRLAQSVPVSKSPGEEKFGLQTPPHSVPRATMRNEMWTRRALSSPRSRASRKPAAVRPIPRPSTLTVVNGGADCAAQLEIAEAADRHVLGHPQAPQPRLGDDAEGDVVGAAADRDVVLPWFEQRARGGARVGDVGRGRHLVLGHDPPAARFHRFDETLAAGHRADVACAHDGHVLVAVAEEMGGDGAADLGWSKPTSMSVGSSAMSQISTTGTRASTSIRRAASLRWAPVSSSPSGRRERIWRNSASSSWLP